MFNSSNDHQAIIQVSQSLYNNVKHQKFQAKEAGKLATTMKNQIDQIFTQFIETLSQYEQKLQSHPIMQLHHQNSSNHQNKDQLIQNVQSFLSNPMMQQQCNDEQSFISNLINKFSILQAQVGYPLFSIEDLLPKKKSPSAQTTVPAQRFSQSVINQSRAQVVHKRIQKKKSHQLLQKKATGQKQKINTNKSDNQLNTLSDQKPRNKKITFGKLVNFGYEEILHKICTKENIRCHLCHQNKDKILGDIYQVTNSTTQQDYYVHDVCALWSTNLYFQDKKNLFEQNSIELVFDRCEQTFCLTCGQRNATLLCTYHEQGQCKNAYHFPCFMSNKDHGVITNSQDFEICCGPHTTASKIEKATPVKVQRNLTKINIYDEQQCDEQSQLIEQQMLEQIQERVSEERDKMTEQLLVKQREFKMIKDNAKLEVL